MSEVLIKFESEIREEGSQKRTSPEGEAIENLGGELRKSRTSSQRLGRSLEASELGRQLLV